MKQKYYLYWFNTYPLPSLVMLIVGDYHAAAKEVNRKYKRKNGSLDFEDLINYLDRVQTTAKGRTLFEDNKADVVVYFPNFPSDGALSHELLHIVQHILEFAGVKDSEGEIDAYYLEAMVDHFSSSLKRDKNRKISRGKVQINE